MVSQSLNETQKNYFKRLMIAMFNISRESELRAMLDDEAFGKGYYIPCLFKLEKKIQNKFKNKYKGSIAKFMQEHYTQDEWAYGNYFMDASVAFICEWLYLFPQYKTLEVFKGAIVVFEVKPFIKR